MSVQTFASLSRIAERCSVSKPCVSNWFSRGLGMPEPDAWVRQGSSREVPVWAADGQAVVDWAAKRLEARAQVAETKAQAARGKAARARRRVERVG